MVHSMYDRFLCTGATLSLFRLKPAVPRVGLNIPQIKLLAIWVGGMHCVIVKKVCGAHFFGGGGFKHAPPKVGGNKIILRYHTHKPKRFSLPHRGQPPWWSLLPPSQRTPVPIKHASSPHHGRLRLCLVVCCKPGWDTLFHQ
jgi:hypothetical protein